MPVTEFLVALCLWLLWLAYWLLSARQLKKPLARESSRSRTLQSVPITLGGLLVLVPALAGPPFDLRFAEPQPGLGLALLVAGLLFTVWAREFLGSNWSAEVAIRQGHELVRGGPYRWVRHPIYTGGLVATLGTALIGGQWRGLLGLLLVAGTLDYKRRLEERWLSAEFGEAYRRYQAEVPALVPLVY